MKKQENHEMMPVDQHAEAAKEDFEAKVAEWKRQYGEVYMIEVDASLLDPEADDVKSMEEARFVFRKPERTHLSRFAKGALTNTLNATANLVYDCLLYPDKSVVKQLLEEKPGMAIGLSGELQKTVGMGQDFFRKKL